MPSSSCTRLFLRSLIQQKSACFNRKFSLPSSSKVEEKVVNYSYARREALEQARFETKDHQEVEITEFISSHPKVTAIIKKRSSDFQVHEIDQNGKIVQLTDITPPEPPPDWNIDYGQSKCLECTMYKEAVTHADAHDRLTRKLGISRDRIRFAGRKDKSAQTTQRISILDAHEIPLEKLHIQTKLLKLGNYTYCTEPLNYGQSRGNHFKILLRNIQLYAKFNHDDDGHLRTKAIETAMTSLRDVGFINYFGLQRFGLNSAPIGRAILQNDWKQVFDLLLAVLPTDEGYVEELKNLWKNERDPEKMLKCIPHNRRSHDRELICAVRGLATHYKGGKGDLQAAYRAIPFDLRLIHTSAFTSLLWNHIVSYRIQRVGLRLLPGDLVSSEDTRRDDGRMSLRGIKMLKKKDIVQGHPYSIYDVVLPIFGYQLSKYSVPKLQQVCEEFLASYDLPSNCFSQLELRDELEKGYYRHMIVKPENVDYKIIKYNVGGNVSKYMPSDLDLLQNPQLSQEQPDDVENIQNNNHHPDNKLIGAVIEFSLPSAAYATMALRELMMSANFSQWATTLWKPK